MVSSRPPKTCNFQTSDSDKDGAERVEFEISHGVDDPFERVDWSVFGSFSAHQNAPQSDETHGFGALGSFSFMNRTAQARNQDCSPPSCIPLALLWSQL